MKLSYLFLPCLLPILCQGQVFESYDQIKEGVKVATTEGMLGIYPICDNAVRIKFHKNDEAAIPELVFTSSIVIPKFQVSETPEKLEVACKNIQVNLNKQTGQLSFADHSGRAFLSEKSGTRKLFPDTVLGEPCFLAEQGFESPDDESIFGLGQFQDGQYNLRNVTRRLTQVNSQIAIPFIYSSKGYGLIWHQYGLTDFNPSDHVIELEKQEQSKTGDKQVGEVTTTSGTQQVSQDQSLYAGTFSVPQDGVYSIFLDLGDMDNRQYVVLDGKPCLDFSNFWLPPTACALVELKAGEHHAQVVCKSSNSPNLSWKLAADETTFRSPHAKELDYVVIYGPSADSVIAAYRTLSGTVPMLPLWAYGFWQCRERYTSGAHLVETVREFRKRRLPMDVIVQDWQYWGDKGWGVPQFDETHYSNPAGFIKELHDLNAHFNISIWSNPDKNSDIGKAFAANNRFIPGTKWLDYFNPDTRKEYWNTLKTNMFDFGVDSWWMDAVEPENDALKGQMTHAGLGDFYRLTYPLMVSKAVYEGQRETTSDKRVCILTRSAFLGQQKYGVINWSGDIGGTWDSFRRQIVAGLNYTLTGLPYWTTDIGGFFRPGKSQYTDKNYRELLTRWFQWGAFCPIFRVHGFMSETEPWHYGETVEANMRKMLDLRYRMLPYIYSEAWKVTRNGSTLMRPLIMDFRDDTAAVGQSHEYLFGKSILVAPVIEPGVNACKVYLPKSAGWYDFWSGQPVGVGQTIKTDAPLDKIPLFVKAGSILPVGPEAQYAAEKKWDDLEIRVYPGADGEFTLYEDENDNYDYEKGAYSIIVFSWNDAERSLTIKNRQGSFPGMLAERTFNIVRVTRDKGKGMDVCEKRDKAVKYAGKKIRVTL